MTVESSFLLAGLRRSGTTTLMRLLISEAKLSCVREPFNPANFDGKFHRLALEHGLDRQLLAEARQGKRGLKHVWEVDGWPFPDRPDLNRAILAGVGDRIVLVRRRNLLQRIVSLHLSSESGVWTPFTSGDRARVASLEYPPLDPAAVSAGLVRDQRELAAVILDLGARREPLLVVDYEDLYVAGDRPADRRAVYTSVVRFLGGPIPSAAERWHEIDRWLDPARTRLASADVYRRIANIDELEARCGSDEAGWLFR